MFMKTLQQGFLIRFGDKRQALSLGGDTQKIIVNKIGETVFLHQIHSNTGKVIENIQDSFAEDGDFIFTSKPNLAIGVLTADCLPIIITDNTNISCAVVHAGWRGTIKEIVIKTIECFLNNGSKIKNLKIFFGPCIGTCCYEVKNDFISQLPNKNCIIERDNKTFFDIIDYNRLLLLKNGLNLEQIDLSNWQCTFCNENFCSFRRSNGSKERQYSIVKII